MKKNIIIYAMTSICALSFLCGCNGDSIKKSNLSKVFSSFAEIESEQEETDVDNKGSIGNFIFDVPEGWAYSEDGSTEHVNVYAPNGKYTGAESAFYLRQDYISENEEYDVKGFANNPDAIKSALAGSWEGIEILDVQAENSELSFGEEVTKADFRFFYEGYEGSGIVYYIKSGRYIYTFQAIEFDNSKEPAIDVLVDILANGELVE